jgi:AAA domain
MNTMMQDNTAPNPPNEAVFLAPPSGVGGLAASYQAANADEPTIKKGFVIRVGEFERIMAAITNKKADDPAQHELLLGRRGSGKSTLLRRLKIEIDETLANSHIAINTAEEQASIYRLSDLWYEVLQELGKKLGFTPELRPFSSFESNNDYTRYLHLLIHNVLQKHQRRLVLLLDNLDRIVSNLDDEGNLLRETLLNYNDIQLIGGSTRMDEHFWKYDKPFYEFFRRHRLEGLTFDEIHLLLNHWSETMQLPALKDYALLHRGKIESIRIMTDGLPRTLLFFIQILLQDATLYGFDYIRKVMNDTTPLYQERLNNLTPPQRKIVQEMAFLWEACATKQLIDVCRMEGKLISSYMKQLTAFGIVETIETSTKNHLYRLSERFFNMWLIVTQGNPDQKRKAKWLTVFLEAWYDETDIQALTKQHLENLKSKNLTYDKALVLSKALSQSKYIGVFDRDKLISGTLDLKENKINDSYIPKTYEEILLNDIYRLIKANNLETALQKIEEIENEGDGTKFIIKSLVLDMLNRPDEAIFNYQKGIDKAGDKEGIQYLIVFFLYNTNKIKKKALEAVRRLEDRELQLELIIEIWNGNFENIQKKIDAILNTDDSIIKWALRATNNTLENIKEMFEKVQYKNLDWFLENLLYLEQTNLVLSLFESEVHGKELRERYTLLYYATLILLNKTENNLLLRIPPEVLPTLQGIVAQVREKQAFYGA